MKKTRRIAAMVAAMALAATMAAPMCAGFTASATSVSVKTGDDKATHTYTAYQIFTGSYNDNGLTISDWATGYNSTGLLADEAFKKLVIDAENNVTVGSFLDDKTDAASTAQAIEKLNYTSESADADRLASILQKYIGTAQPTTLTSTAVDLAAGYWIVLDSYTADGDASDGNSKPDAVSKHVLRVSGGTDAIEITPKKSYPTVVKKVQENTDVDNYQYTVGTTNVTDADYNDVADYNIGDSVPFKLYGTMPSTYGDYDHYYYLFTDTLGTQFTAPAETDIVVKVVNPDGDDPDTEADVTTLDSGYTVTIVSDKISVEFMDTKSIASITKDSVITVEYTAVLNKNAAIGRNGQENKVDLEYSNNPNNTGDGTSKPTDTDKTPEDKVIVFTYEQDIKKVDAATGVALKDAVFTLSKTVTEDGESVTYYVKVDSNNKVDGWTTDATAASELKTDTDGICKVIGLDDGTYTLKEKTPPTSYNAIDADMSLVINATTYNGQNWTGSPLTALTEISLTASGDGHIIDITNELTGEAESNKGTVQAKVTNDKGINLPTTGGMGTKLFILGGGVTAALAGVYLVSKKRAKNAE